MNHNIQYYKQVPLRQIKRSYKGLNARRFVLNDTRQNVWIPNKYLFEDGTLKPGVNIDFVFQKCKQKFYLAGIIALYEPFKRPNY